MPFIVWNDKDLGLNIERMDREHRGLIDTMNRLFDLNEAGAKKRELEYALEILIGQVVTHFAHEEEFLKSSGYPGIELRKGVHKRLLNRLHELVMAFEHGNGQVPAELFGFLSIWLTSHIMGNDREYAKYIEDWKKKQNAYRG